MNMRCFDLLYDRKYFSIFLDYFNRVYGQVYSQREKRYERLIRRYRSHGGQVAGLIGDRAHINDVYESLGKEFNMAMRAAKLVPLKEFFDSIQAHRQTIIALGRYRMDSIDPNNVHPSMLTDLRQLFYGLGIVPPYQKRKLVAVAKTLHLLLPDLVMPVDNAGVLRALAKGGIPEDIGKQCDLLIEILKDYLDLTARLGLKQSNSDGNWWNISVPKRIDNAIGGLWMTFNDRNIEYLICNHTDTLLTPICKQLASVSATPVPRASATVHATQFIPQPPTTAQKVRGIKQGLAATYISDPQEKRLFLKTDDKNIHDWGCYIAGLVLTKAGKTWFERKDITSQLKALVPNYGSTYLRESTVLPADVCYDSKDVQYPCLEADRCQKPYRYKFIGFKAAIMKAFGPNRLQQMLSDC